MINFQEIIWKHRKALINAGYKYSTLWAWWSGLRIPRHENLPGVWRILTEEGEEIGLHELPYYKVERKK